jgi:hypothetical protein
LLQKGGSPPRAFAPNSVERFERHIATLSKEFGGRLIWDIGVDDIAALQRRGTAEGKTPRTSEEAIKAPAVCV